MTDDELESIRRRKRDELLEATERKEGREGEKKRQQTERSESSETDEPIHVESVEHFSKLTADPGVTLVDFYADWCGPCNMLEPIVASVARKTDATVAKVDTDQHQGLAAQYGVRSLPTLVLFADGEQVEQLVGMQDEANLTRLVQRYA